MKSHLADKMAAGERGSVMRVIALVSQKGGSGKTTVAVNLAVAAHEAGKTALVVDLDLQASATEWHNARSDKSLIVLPTHPAGLSRVIESAREQGADFVFIDTAAKTETDTVAAIEAADVALIPCRPSIVDLRAVQNTIRICRYREITPHVVLTQTETQGTVADEARAMLVQLGVNVLPETLGRRIAFSHSMIEGQGVSEFDPRGKGAQEVRALLERVSRLDGKPSSHLAIGKTRKTVG
jgi:chromosome partitioning protein